MTFGSLFAGIGGIDLGFERAGMRCLWQVEINPFCRRVLAKHWPAVKRFEDVREFATDHDCAGLAVDVIAGGFPCQDISNAGKRAGIGGERSGLWSEYARIIRVLRPRFVVMENVSALLVRGIDRVLGNLASCGYDAEWDCIPAASVGAPHRRDRVFIVAHATGCGLPAGARLRPDEKPRRRREPARCGQNATNAASFGRGSRRSRGSDSSGSWEHEPPLCQSREDGVRNAVFAGLEGHERGVLEIEDFRRHNADPAGPGWWATEPRLGRVANGVPNRVDRLKGLGNAVVPQVAEWIGRRLMAMAGHQ